MAPQTPNDPRKWLRPRARLLRTLGEELISNEVVAVIELVKNAYDADATQVLVRFVGPLEPGQGRIEVMDDGNGMALETVETVSPCDMKQTIIVIAGLPFEPPCGTD